MSKIRAFWRKVHLLIWMMGEGFEMALGIIATGSVLSAVIFGSYLLEFYRRLQENSSDWLLWREFLQEDPTRIDTMLFPILTCIIVSVVISLGYFRENGGWTTFRDYCRTDWAERVPRVAEQHDNCLKRIAQQEEECCHQQAKLVAKVRSTERRINYLQQSINERKARADELEHTLQAARILYPEGFEQE